MKAFKNIFAIFSFVAAMVLFAGNAQAQSTSSKVKAVKSTEVKACPTASHSCCTMSGSKTSAAACPSKGAGSASNVSSGTDNAAPAAKRSDCKGANKSCCPSKAKKEGSSL